MPPALHALDAVAGPTASVHPLQTIWPERGPDQLEGAYAAVTGDWDLGAGLARELGMTPFPLEDSAKPVYHAASAFASNYLVTLTQVAVGLLERAGLERRGGAGCARAAPARARSRSPASPPPARSHAATPTPCGPTCRPIGPDLEPLYRELGRATLPLVSPQAAAAPSGTLL